MLLPYMLLQGTTHVRMCVNVIQGFEAEEEE
jgi:hypothetical protein